MKDVGQESKKADFRVKKGFEAYSRLSMVAGLIILGTIPLAIWSYTQHPEWLGIISQSINGEDYVKNSSDNLPEVVNPPQTKNDNKKQPSKAEPINLPPKDIKKTTKQNQGLNLTGEIFRRIPDQTTNLSKEENSKDPNPKPKSSQLTNLFPALPKTFISPFEVKKDNNTFSSRESIVRKSAATPLITPSTENPLRSSIRRFNTNQSASTPINNNSYNTASPYQQAQPYTASPYQAQPYTASPYQAQPYTASPYQAQPYTASPYQAQPYTVTPYQAQPSGAGAPINQFRN